LIKNMVGTLNKNFTVGAKATTVHEKVRALKRKKSNRDLYRLVTKLFMESRNHPSKKWPSTWMKLSVTELADKIF